MLAVAQENFLIFFSLTTFANETFSLIQKQNNMQYEQKRG